MKALGGSELGVAGIGASREFYLARPPIDNGVMGTKPGKPDDHSLGTNVRDVIPLGGLMTLDIGSELSFVGDGSLVWGIVDVVGVKRVTEFACGDVVVLNKRGGDVGGVGSGIEERFYVVRFSVTGCDFEFYVGELS